MAILPAGFVQNTFESGTNGATVTTANSVPCNGMAFDGIDTTNTVTITYSNTYAHSGTQCCNITTPSSGGGRADVRWSTSLTGQTSGCTQAWFREYLYFTANPTNSHAVLGVFSGATPTLEVWVTNTGAIQVRNGGSTVVNTMATALPLNAWFRIEGYCIASATVGQFSLSIYTNPDSYTATETYTSAANLNSQANITNINFGAVTTSANSINFYLDDVGASTVAPLGPIQALIPTYQSVSTATTGGTAASSLSIAAPAGLSTGATMLMGVATASAAAVTTPTGWGLVNTATNAGTIATRTYWRIATAADLSASYSLALGSTVMTSAAIVSYTGTHPFQPLRGNSTNTSSSPSTVATVTGTAQVGWTGRPVSFAGMYNTSAASTIGTLSAAYTVRADVCTTASPYIELAVLAGQGVSSPMNNVNSLGSYGNVTSTGGTVSWATATVELQEIHYGTMPIEIGQFGQNTNTIAPERTGQLCLCWAINRAGTEATTSVTSSSVNGASTAATTAWSQAAVYHSTSPKGNLSLWSAVSSANGVNSGVSTNYGGTPASTYNASATLYNAATHGVNGLAAIGTIATMSSSSTAPSITLTTTGPNSMIMLVGNDPSHNTTATATGTGLTLVNSGDAGNSCEAWAQYYPLAIPAAGTQVVVGDATPSADSVNLMAVEILAPPNDAGSFTDAASGVALPATDNGAFSSTVKGISLPVTDNGSFSSAVKSISLPVTDAAAFTSIVRGISLPSSDSGAFSSLVKGISLPVTDTAGFASSVKGISFPVTDNGSFSSLVKGISLPVRDSASFHESALVTVGVPGTSSLARSSPVSAVTNEAAGSAGISNAATGSLTITDGPL